MRHVLQVSRSRRFPPPWQVVQRPGGYKVLDANGQSLGFGLWDRLALRHIPPLLEVGEATVQIPPIILGRLSKASLQFAASLLLGYFACFVSVQNLIQIGYDRVVV
jgi:hypothetical protein